MREEVAYFLFFEAQAHFRVISVSLQTAGLCLRVQRGGQAPRLVLHAEGTLTSCATEN